MLRYLLICVLVFVTISASCATESPGKVLLLLEKGFNRSEHFPTYHSLKALGYTVDIASPHGGIVYTRNDGTPDPRGRDVESDLRVADANIDDYLTVVVPGGYSPASLEEVPAVIDLVRAFQKTGKPMAAVCHGPRLFVNAGIMEGHVMTGLHTLSDECAGPWQDGAFGTYLDKSLVIDGQFITARYPGDVPVWARAVAQRLGEQTGVAVPVYDKRIRIVAEDQGTGHARWLLAGTMDVFGLNVRIVKEIPDDADLVLNLSDLPPVDQFIDLAPHLLTIAAEKFTQYTPEVPVYDAVVALRPGFDESVVLALMPQLQATGKNVLVVAPQVGWVHSLNGVPVEAHASYEAVPNITADALIIAPGGLWPRFDPNVRQAEQPEWVIADNKLEMKRREWVLARHEGGSPVIAFGFDSLGFGRMEAFAGKQVATSDQARWSFGKGGGKYNDELLAETKEKFWTVKGAIALPQVISTLNEMSAQ